MSFSGRLWRMKWCILRLLIAGFILWAIAADTPARLSRVYLASLPGFDYAGEAKALRLQGRLGESQVIAEAGLRDEDVLADPARKAAIEQERTLTEEERASLLRRVKAAGMGALSGRGDSLEGLLGAVAADFFIVGDVRDLVIEGGKQLLDGESDELIILLSVAGVVTTVAPEIDWAPSILKAARRAGALPTKLADHLRTALRGRDTKALERVVTDTAILSKHASPGGTIRLMRLADGPEGLARMARFAEREPDAAFALLVTRERGVRALAQGGIEGEKLLVKAARKGEAGAAFLDGRRARALLKPHPILGVAKAVYKGNAEALVRQVLDRLGPHAWWALPLAAAWTVLELMLLARGLTRPRHTPPRAPAPASATPRPRAYPG